MHACKYACMCECECVCVHVYINIKVYMYMYMYIYIYIICICVCAQFFYATRLPVFTCNPCLRMHIYIYIYRERERERVGCTYTVHREREFHWCVWWGYVSAQTRMCMFKQAVACDLGDKRRPHIAIRGVAEAKMPGLGAPSECPRLRDCSDAVANPHILENTKAEGARGRSKQDRLDYVTPRSRRPLGPSRCRPPATVFRLTSHLQCQICIQVAGLQPGVSISSLSGNLSHLAYYKVP